MNKRKNGKETEWLKFFEIDRSVLHPLAWQRQIICADLRSGAGIMEADDRQVTTVFSPTVIPLSAVDKPSIMKRYHRRRKCSHTSPRRLPTMVTLHGTRFVQCRWWNNGWTVKTVVTRRSSASMIPAPDHGADHML